MDKVIDMKFAVDRIEGDIAVLENLETKEKLNVRKKDLPLNVFEKDVLLYKNNCYVKDFVTKRDRLSLLKNKMERLKKGN